MPNRSNPILQVIQFFPQVLALPLPCLTWPALTNTRFPLINKALYPADDIPRYLAKRRVFDRHDEGVGIWLNVVGIGLEINDLEEVGFWGFLMPDRPDSRFHVVYYSISRDA